MVCLPWLILPSFSDCSTIISSPIGFIDATATDSSINATTSITSAVPAIDTNIIASVSTTVVSTVVTPVISTINAAIIANVISAIITSVIAIINANIYATIHISASSSSTASTLSGVLSRKIIAFPRVTAGISTTTAVSLLHRVSSTISYRVTHFISWTSSHVVVINGHSIGSVSLPLSVGNYCRKASLFVEIVFLCKT